MHFKFLNIQIIVVVACMFIMKRLKGVGRGRGKGRGVARSQINWWRCAHQWLTRTRGALGNQIRMLERFQQNAKKKSDWHQSTHNRHYGILTVQKSCTTRHPAYLKFIPLNHCWIPNAVNTIKKGAAAAVATIFFLHIHFVIMFHASVCILRQLTHPASQKST